MAFPADRPRRLRSSPGMRRLVAETHLQPAHLILPMFIAEGISDPRPIASMPGVVQHTRESARKIYAEAAALGIGGVMLFGVPEHKDATGSGALDPSGILNVALGDARSEVGDDLLVMADLCLDEFTDHGHCGVLDPSGRVDNDATIEIYAQLGVVQAESGAHVVGPSGMMDGQVAAGLDAAGWPMVAILAYSAKYASAFYGPFREAVDSSLQGDRATYQQDPANAREAVREALLDVAEGADIVMVKPALSYLDLIADVRAAVDVPVAAYNVSGELAMVEAAAANGWIDRDRAIDEVLLSIRRAVSLTESRTEMPLARHWDLASAHVRVVGVPGLVVPEPPDGRPPVLPDPPGTVPPVRSPTSPPMSPPRPLSVVPPPPDPPPPPPSPGVVDGGGEVGLVPPLVSCFLGFAVTLC